MFKKMKKNLIIVIVGVFLIGALFVTTSFNSNPAAANEGHGIKSSTDLPEDNGNVENVDAKPITLTSDEGCKKDPYGYVKEAEVPQGEPDGSIRMHLATKCFATKLADGIYTTGFLSSPMQGNEAWGDVDTYVVAYVYGSGIDFKNDVELLMKNGKKIKASDKSVINTNEGYLVFEATKADGGYDGVNEVILTVNGKEYLLSNFSNFGVEPKKAQ
ncbi:MAG: hypothetical protein ACRCUP_05500 [Mycoplasmatales bacterium]